MSFDHKKPMATVSASSLVSEISSQLTRLKDNDRIQAVHSQWLNGIYVVWVGICDDDSDARKGVYSLEDQISDRYPQVSFDFHVIALPEGKKIQDYVSSTQVVFQRTA